MKDRCRIILYSGVVYLLFIISGLYLAHGEEVTSLKLPNGSAFPQEYDVPRISKTMPAQPRRATKSCREYLSICERSCKDRGDLFKFACIGQDFQPFEEHFRCTCSDDLFARRAPKQEMQVKQEGEQ